LDAVQRGATPDVAQFLAEHAEFVAELNLFFANQSQIRQSAEKPASGSKSEGPAPGDAPSSKTNEATLTFRERALRSPRDIIHRFGDYELLQEIARGGMGIVFKARQVKLNRIVAVKMILSGQLAGPEDVERFHVEAEAAAQLDHPGIVPIYEVGHDEGQYFFSMGFVDGQSLSKKVAEGPLPAREAAGIVRDVADAVHYAHDKGVIHRDLKPGNILLDKAGKARVTDFGLAKLIESSSELTGTGQILGTPSYMPPEQATGQVNDVGRASDVYSLGAILYCLLTGRPPFQAANPLETLLQVQKQQPVPPTQLNPNIPPDLDTIALKCLDKSPSRRYPTANALAEELNRYLEGRPILARRVSRAERFWRWCKREPVLASLTMAVIVAFIVGTAVTVSFFWIRIQRDEADAARIAAESAKDKEFQARSEAEAAQAAAELAKDQEVQARSEAEDAKNKSKTAELDAIQAREQGEYQAYIAQIGLAAAKIDENAFGSARDLLNECKAELRNWEWGRLMYLCGLEVRSVQTDAPIDAVAFSADGTKFITGGWNHSAEIWETASGKPLATLPHDGLYVHAVALSPDGKFVATGGNDRRAPLRLWEVATGRPVLVGEFSGHGDAVLSVAFSRDGTKLLSASYDKTARLWDTKSGKELKSFLGHSWWVWAAAFSPDEERVVTASQDGSAIIWRTETGARIAQFLEHRGPVYSAAFSPDGDRVVTGGYDKRVLVWRPADVRPFDFRKLAEGVARASVPYRAFEGHGAPVRSVSFSRDGALIVSGSHDNTVRVWDSPSGRTVRTFRGHDSWVRSCAFSPDGRTVVSASHDHRATLWNITNYEEVRVLQGKILDGHNDAVLSASFNHDGNTIVTASRDRSAKTWDFVTGRELKSFEEGHAFLASNAVFFPGGRRVLTSAVDNTTRFWDVTSGTQTARLDHTGRAAALAVSADGTRILTGGDDKTAKLWDAENGRLIKALAGHKREVTALAFSADGCWLFTGDSAGRGILWNAHTLEETHHLRSHNDKITAAAFLPDSSRLLTASNDKTVAQWDPREGKDLLPLTLKHPTAVLSLAVIPGRRQALTSCADRSVRVWDVDTARQDGSLPVAGDVNGIAVSADGRRAITVNSEQRTVRLWDIESRREILVAQGKDRLGAFLDLNRTRGQLWTAVFSPEGDAILTVGGTDARLWDMQNGAERMSFSPNGIVASAGFSPDGRWMVTGSWDNAARVWDVASGKAVMKLEGQHTGYVNTAVYSPDGSLILTASDDRTAVLWNARTGAILTVLRGHGDRVRSTVFSPDGTKILTASNDKTVRLWETATGNEIGKLEGHKWAVLSAAFSPDGTKVITGSEDNTAIIWDVTTREQLLPPLEGHSAPITSVAFLPDAKNPAGTRVLTGSQDITAKLWDAATGKEIFTLKGHSREVTSVDASRDGRYVVTASLDGTAVIWPTIPWTPDSAVVQFTNR
jgi:WD40 repeat protein/tRNA A-37 threonylcarbamoyl transferase component Bud32